MLSLKKLLTAALLIFVVSIVGKAEAGIVTDKMPLQCYVDHKVTSYDLNSGQAVGWIDAEVDLVQIEEIGGNGVARGTHPGRNGTVRRLFWARDVFADTNYANRPAHVNGYHEVYRTSSSGSTIGSVRDEDVTVVADNGSRAQIVYRLNNGTGYKMGWVPSSIVANNQPIGANFKIDSYNLTCPSDHQLRFQGRVWNENDNSEITGVHVYIGGGVGAGGEFMGEFRSDSNHNFDKTLNVPQHRNGNQLIVIYAVNGKDAGELNRTNINVSGGSTSNGDIVQPMKNWYCTWRSHKNWSWGDYNYNSSHPERSWHLGLDVYGDNGYVYAMADGTVVSCSNSNNGGGANGRYIVIKHENIGGRTCYSFYAHLASIKVSDNQQVRAGEHIATAGGSGYGRDDYYGTHLHFAIVDKFSAGKYYGYATKFSGDSVNYGNVTFYNPRYVLQNKHLP